MVEYKNSYHSSLSKGSLGNNLLLTNTDEFINKDYSYKRRIGRVCTVANRPNNKFNKVIVPYDFDKKKYIIKLKEIEFYEHTHYLKEKLDYFCNLKVFHIEGSYEPSSCEKFLIFLLYVVIVLIIAYVFFTIATIFSYNPFIIYLALVWLKKGYLKIKVFKFILLEKWKIKKINKVLQKENLSEFCSKNKLKWILGQSGYWIEIQKLVE
jgi:hypothetical protein